LDCSWVRSRRRLDRWKWIASFFLNNNNNNNNNNSGMRMKNGNGTVGQRVVI
jgi:hypothetical protein